MNIVKWIFAIIALGLVLIAIGTSDTFAKDEWHEKPVLCNESHEAILKDFYYKEGLSPMMGGTTMIRLKENLNETVEGVIYIMFDYENNSAAVMEYTADQVCALAFFHNVVFDVEVLKGYLNYDEGF
mgnify:CR=1 FL=1